jgi:hypothetical protein
MEAMRKRFEAVLREGGTLSDVHSYYSGAHRNTGDDTAESLLPALSNPSRLPALLSKYNTMEAIRRKHGYSKTREKIENEIFSTLDYHKGFDALRKFQKAYDPDYTIIGILKSMVGREIGDKEVLDIASSLTTEEITWLSALKEMPGRVSDDLLWIPAIVDYFYDGVEWAWDTVDYRASQENPRDNFDRLGISGARSDTKFTAFKPKFALALRGLYFGMVADSQVYERVVDELASSALVSGDNKIMRAFCHRDGKDFSEEYVGKIRGKVNKFLSEITLVYIYRAKALSPKEVVAFIGLLEEMPELLFKKKHLAFVPCGQGFMFLDPTSLKEIEYVEMDPYVGHYAQTEIHYSEAYLPEDQGTDPQDQRGAGQLLLARWDNSRYLHRAWDQGSRVRGEDPH